MEQRRHPRASRRLEALLLVDANAYLGRISNLSMSGAFLEVEQHIPFLVEPIVRVHFLLPTAHGIFPLSIDASVAWIDGVENVKTGFGLTFDKLEAAQLTILQAHMQSGQASSRNRDLKDVAVVEQALAQWATSGQVPVESVGRYRSVLVKNSSVQ